MRMFISRTAVRRAESPQALPPFTASRRILAFTWYPVAIG